MKFIAPGSVSGSVRPPGSKSMTQRALLLAACGDQPSILQHPNLGADTLACLRLVRALGAAVEVRHDTILVQGNAQPRMSQANCGESGTALRMGAAIAALTDQPLDLITSGTLRQRPHLMIIDALTAFGASATLHDQGLTVKGPLRSNCKTLSGAASSQHLSGLLLALPHCQQTSQLRIVDAVSSGYLDCTLAVAQAFGLHYQFQHSAGVRQYTIAGRQSVVGQTFSVEADWSAAAFLLVAAALTGTITVTGLSPDSNQPDRRIVDVLHAVGANLAWTAHGLRCEQGERRSFSVDLTDAPDLAPPLAALALGCTGVSWIAGIDRLTTKESNRAATLCSELAKIGADIQIRGNRLRIVGGRIHGGNVKSHQDHRIAMALTCCGLICVEGLTIDDTDCVEKSYPQFFTDVAQMMGS